MADNIFFYPFVLGRKMSERVGEDCLQYRTAGIPRKET